MQRHTTQAPARPFRVQGFTLIELLVVITIVSVLIAVLLPSLSKARAVARAVVCQSNLRQMAQSLDNYSYEFRDHIPPLYPDTSLALVNSAGAVVSTIPNANPVPWPFLMGRFNYIPMRKDLIAGSPLAGTVLSVGIFRCPDYLFAFQYVSSYGLNHQFFNDNFGAARTLFPLRDGTGPGPAQRLYAFRRNAMRLASPSQVLMVGDSSTSSAYSIGQLLNYPTVGIYDFDPRHPNSCANAVFLDGHSKAISTRFPYYGNISSRFWNARWYDTSYALTTTTE